MTEPKIKRADINNNVNPRLMGEISRRGHGLNYACVFVCLQYLMSACRRPIVLLKFQSFHENWAIIP